MFFFRGTNYLAGEYLQIVFGICWNMTNKFSLTFRKSNKVKNAFSRKLATVLEFKQRAVYFMVYSLLVLRVQYVYNCTLKAKILHRATRTVLNQALVTQKYISELTKVPMQYSSWPHVVIVFVFLTITNWGNSFKIQFKRNVNKPSLLQK